MKHTPGPWHAQADPEWKGKHPYHDYRFITCGNPDIESDEWMHDPSSYIIAKMTDCQNQKQNAQLIAAAPELLEACEALLRDCVCPLGQKKADRWSETCDKAKWAIRKAKGQA